MIRNSDRKPTSTSGSKRALAYIGLHPRYRAYRVLQALGRRHWPLFREILRVGWPTALVLAAENGMFMATGTLIGLFGPDPLAG